MSCYFSDVGDWRTGIPNQAGCSSGREDFETEFAQACSEVGDAALVKDADESRRASGRCRPIVLIGHLHGPFPCPWDTSSAFESDPRSKPVAISRMR